MWNVIKGVNPIKKRKTEDRTLYNSEYESSKRVVRSYCTEWEKDRPWLKLTDDGMVCLACQAHGDKTVMYQFINGCVTYKLDSIQKHQKSKGHEKSLLIEKAKNESKAESKASKIIQTLNTENFQKLDKAFRNVHAMVQHSRPLGDYVWMCELDEMKGVQLGNTYCNQKSANVFIKAITETEFKNVASTIMKGKFICMIGDGSTDSSIKEQEMWYLCTSLCGQVSVDPIHL